MITDSPFLIEYNKANFMSDISDFVLKVMNNFNRKRNLNKSYTNLSWYLTNTLDILIDYSTEYPDMNILETSEYNNIINSIKQILNKDYYELT